MGGNAPSDPCASTGNGGGVIEKKNVKPGGSSTVPVNLTLLCGPRVSWPNAGPVPSTLLYNEAVWNRYLNKSGSPPGAAMEGGNQQLWWNGGASTSLTPFLKGPDAAAPNVDVLFNNEKFKKAVSIIGGTAIGFGVTAVTLCVSSAVVLLTPGVVAAPLLIPTIVGTCGGIIALSGGITAFLGILEGLIITPIASEFWNKYLGGRIDIMSRSDWFAWSDGLGGWNTFGDVSPRAINPSLYGLFGHRIRVGAVFASVAASQGPDFDQAQANTAAAPSLAQVRRLAARQRRAASELKNVDLVALVEGTRQRREPIGAFNGFKRGGVHVFRAPQQDRQDYLYAGRGNVTLDGRAGADTLKAGRGNDTLIGGAGNDKLFGGPGRDSLFGGSGNDLIIDGQGPAVIDTGSGINVVDVRGHRGHDTITCSGSKRNTILAKRGDTIASNCRGTIRRFGSLLPQRQDAVLRSLAPVF